MSRVVSVDRKGDTKIQRRIQIAKDAFQKIKVLRDRRILLETKAY